MKKYLIMGVVLPLLAACGEKPTAVLEMRCGDLDVTVDVYKQHLDARIGEENIYMEQTISASGARYESMGAVLTGLVLWNKGDDWMLMLDDRQTPVSCRVIGG